MRSTATIPVSVAPTNGTKEPRKNLRGLLEAWRILGRKDVRLVLVGPTGWGDDLDAVVLDEGQPFRNAGASCQDDGYEHR